MIGSPAVMTPPIVCDGELVHDAVLRRADVDALELVLGRDLALDQLGDLGLDLAQLLGDLASCRSWIDLDDLQLGLGDLALGLRRSRRRADPRSPSRRAASRSSAVRRGDRHEVLAARARARPRAPG